MPVAARLLKKLCVLGANTELQPSSSGGVLSQLATRFQPAGCQQQQHVQQLSPCWDTPHAVAGDAWWSSSGSRQRCRLHTNSISSKEQEALQAAAAAAVAAYHSSSSSSSSQSGPSDRGGSSSSSSSSSSEGSTNSAAPITASCDVPPNHVLHEAYRNRQQGAVEITGSNTALYKSPTRISAGTVSPDEFQNVDHVLSRFYEEGVHGGLGRRFRRKVPLFQVIEFYANGTAIEEYKPRTPQQLGLHPRDVVLFAPLSRLAAPQRATIVVHEEKVLVKTEIVKAIITPDKAVLIKGRRTADTQKLTQNILAANDQRLMAISLFKQKQAAARAAATQQASAHGCAKAPAAAQLLRAAEVHGNVAAWEHLAEDDEIGWTTSAPADGSGGSSGGFQQHHHGHGSGEDRPAVIRPKRRKAGGSRTELQDVPFGMLVLEVLLDATAEYFYTKVQHLNWMLESVAADLRQPNHSDADSQAAVDKAHQLLPIQKFLTALKNDVKETGDAIKQALEDQQTLQELCEQWQQLEQQRWTTAELQRRRARLALDYPGDALEDEMFGEQVSMIYGATTNKQGFKGMNPDLQVRMMTEMLESYDREIQSLEGSINEAEEDLENTRALWHMQMDSRRNHIIMVNLWLSMLNISVMATTVLPAFFGMNLDNGLDGQDPRFFVLVCGSSLCLSALAYPASRSWYNRNWRRVNQNEVFEQKLLRTILVQHIEDIDSIIKLLKHVRYKWIDRQSFRQLMMATLGSRVISPAHIDFLWSAYDRDRDDLIAAAEKIRPLNTYHSGSANAVEGLQLHPDLPAPVDNPAGSLTASGAHAQSPGYQQFLQQQQQLLQPPHLQQQQPSWAGLMSESALNNLEDMLRNGRGSSSHHQGSGQGRRKAATWDDDWEGPSIEEDEAPRGGRMMQRLHGWLARRQKKKQRRQQQLVAEKEQLQVEEEMLLQAQQQHEQHEQQQPSREQDDNGWRWR